eukprot:9492636-Pyramimonas_sp.AAC.1
MEPARPTRSRTHRYVKDVRARLSSIFRLPKVSPGVYVSQGTLVHNKYEHEAPAHWLTFCMTCLSSTPENRRLTRSE